MPSEACGGSCISQGITKRSEHLTAGTQTISSMRTFINDHGHLDLHQLSVTFKDRTEWLPWLFFDCVALDTLLRLEKEETQSTFQACNLVVVIVTNLCVAEPADLFTVTHRSRDVVRPRCPTYQDTYHAALVLIYECAERPDISAALIIVPGDRSPNCFGGTQMFASAINSSGVISTTYYGTDTLLLEWLVAIRVCKIESEALKNYFGDLIIA